ncbi:prolipoprotein diacylglyceryl transferase [Nocardioides sp.]|uniref:prolipoprotein diacylglyceryl transferase n=1 Tax=Nocardioides sp. TaxID=35761 RepID=UPI003513340D
MIPLTTLAATLPLSIPSPEQGVWHLGPLPIRGYALCIILGIVAAVWIGERRWIARGGRAGEVQDLAIWAVPFGVVGARAYHVATDWERYFGEGKDPVSALYIWKGGLGIWGGVALGALGIWIGARRRGIRLAPMLDALAPGVIVAQAIGRWGNWFNQELFGKPTDLPWGLEVSERTALDAGYPPGTLFHPTFLYESLWNLGVFALLIWADRRFRLGHGRVMALYVMGYTLGRGWIEEMRIDPVQLSDVGGLRFNAWTSIVLFIAGLVFFVLSARRHPGREERVYRDGHEESPTEDTDSAGTATADTTADPAGEPAEDPARE